MDNAEKNLFKSFFTGEAQKKLEAYYSYRKSVIQNQLCLCSSFEQMQGLQGQLRELEILLKFREQLKEG